MREDTIFALLTATAVGIVGLAWYLYWDAKRPVELTLWQQKQLAWGAKDGDGITPIRYQK
jgi:hypothetical protein